MSAVLLLSGGIESSVLLAREAKSLTYTLFIDYGQRAARREQAAAEAQSARHGVQLRRLDLSSVGDEFRGLHEYKLHVPLPHRNLVALALALSFAANAGARRILLALNRADTLAYPSASPDFVAAFAALARTLGDFSLETPLIELGKAEIIAEGIRLNVNFAQTWSCLLGYAMPCRRCSQCRNRAAAFAAARVPDMLAATPE